MSDNAYAFWARTRSASRRPSPNNVKTFRSEDLTPRNYVTLLHHACWGAANIAGPGRSLPSAGAVYPLEFEIRANGSDLAKFGVSYSMLTWPVGSENEAFNFDNSDFAEISVIVRPWKSMQKYGPRGYWYSALDAGHAISNLVRYIISSGLELIRVDSKLPHSKDAAPSCGYTMAILTVCPKHSSSHISAHARTYLSDVNTTNPTQSPGLKRLQLLCNSHSSRSTQDSYDALRQRTKARFSARGFYNLPVAKGNVLTWLRGIAHESGPDILDIRVFCRNVTELTGGYKFSKSAESLIPIHIQDSISLVDVCGGQQLVAEAAGFVVFSAQVKRTIEDFGISGALIEHCISGYVAQNLYMQAVTSGLVTTSIGAFDEDLTRTAVGIPEDYSPLYLMAFGLGHGSGTKLDAVRS